MAKAKPSNAADLNDPRLFINRELSLLEFNRRVLAQATNPNVPLLERLRFLCISCSNLDEFFEIRYSGLRQQEVFGADQRGPDNLSPTEQIRRISGVAHELVDAQYQVLNENLLPALALEGVRFLSSKDWNPKQAQWVKRFFARELSPILSPIGLDPAHPFPQVLNKGLNFMVTLKGKDAFGRNSGRAVIQAPRSLPRIVHLPEGIGQAPYDFVLLSSIIEAHASELLPGMKATGCYAFRVTRNSDLFVDEEEVEDLLQALEGELPSRNFGSAVRMEVAAEMPQDMVSFLRAQFSLDEGDVYTCAGPVNLNRLVAVPDRIERSELKYPALHQRIPESIANANNPAEVFAAVRDRDVLMHHPFDSFLAVVEFLRSAAKDPKVLSIRQTLYRTGADSVIVKALMDAAANGKEVLVVIELRARFDEEANIELATLLQDSGVQVVYGIVGYKTHAKMSLVIRREGKSLKRYVHLGTGNYHPKTTKLYTDYGLLTADAEIGEDVQKLFQQLTSMGRAGKLKKLLQAPFTLHSSLLDFIEGEIDAANSGKPALVQAKMNSLIEPEIIRALYRASQAGVKVQLIVRGICSLRPGIAGVSENIEVRSIIGRFLEHTRVFYFQNRGLYLASADWMGRNFFSRIETCFPVLDERVAERVMSETFENYLRDDLQAWELKADGSYVAPKVSKRGGHSAQQWLLEHRDDAQVRA